VRPGRNTNGTRGGRNLRTAAAVAGIGLLGSLLAACGGTASAAGGAASGQSLTLYSGQHVQTTDALVTQFEKATGITVHVRSDDEDVLANQIAAEGAKSPADVIFTENSQVLEFLQGKGLLAKVSPSTLADTHAKYDSPDDDWVGVSGRVSVILYNPALISESQLPTSVMQLADPKYKGKLAIAPGETDFQPIVTAVERAYGQAAAERWLDQVKVNGSAHNYPDNETIADEVNRGAAAFGLVNEYYWYRMRAEIGVSNTKARITHLAPGNPGYVVDVSGAAIMKSSKHLAAAQKFLAFLVSKQGQDVIANPSESISFEYPIDSGVTSEAGETPFSQLQPYPITISQLGTGTTAIALLHQAGLL
jgi:iron(III) transport system substrate-binding protein